ncbi:MAG TPA: transporter [Gemmatimonadaceae bacterium]|jgi:hypothetical protein|nr:transporter [Gemmatimonadaceae bacterium]
MHAILQIDLPGRRITLATALCCGLLGAARVDAQQPLETETARLPARGAVLVSPEYEFQTSSQGTEHALPFALEVGVTDRLALLVEPVFYTSIRPKTGPSASGAGDLEVTLQYLALRETASRPAVAFAAEVKVPTARNTLIGTRRTDFTPYLIASKRFRQFDLHGNVGYSFVGRPAGLVVQNTLNLALGLEDHVTPRVDLVAEVLSTTAAAGSDAGESSLTAPEIAGAEQVGMLGMRLAVRPRLWLSLGVTYDNTNALLLRPGFTFELP